MSNVDPLADLAIRRQQLENHLLQSHEYREKVVRKLKGFAAIKVVALVLVLLEGFFYLRAPKPAPHVLFALIGATLAALLIGTIFIWRTWRCLNRLNERWLTPEARNALEMLRLEQLRSRERSS